MVNIFIAPTTVNMKRRKVFVAGENKGQLGISKVDKKVSFISIPTEIKLQENIKKVVGKILNFILY